MKKVLTILGTFLLSLIITFFFAETFSIYHLGTAPTFTTFTYLLFIFSFIIYLSLTLTYLISKKVKKEKIDIKKILSLIIFFMSLLLVLGFIVVLNHDWVTYYSNYPSAPFYITIIVRCLEFLAPSTILLIIGIILLLKNTRKNK